MGWMRLASAPLRNSFETLNVKGVAPANQRKGQNEKFMNVGHFCELFWCVSLGKRARFTSNFGSSLPPGEVHELAFLWFGVPGDS